MTIVTTKATIKIVTGFRTIPCLLSFSWWIPTPADPEIVLLWLSTILEKSGAVGSLARCDYNGQKPTKLVPGELAPQAGSAVHYDSFLMASELAHQHSFP
jgi:hypothetical protein